MYKAYIQNWKFIVFYLLLLLHMDENVLGRLITYGKVEPSIIGKYFSKYIIVIIMRYIL